MPERRRERSDGGHRTGDRKQGTGDREREAVLNCLAMLRVYRRQPGSFARGWAGQGACAWVRLLTELRVVVLMKHTLEKAPVSIVFNDL
jgi:hypothetical protein